MSSAHQPILDRESAPQSLRCLVLSFQQLQHRVLLLALLARRDYRAQFSTPPHLLAWVAALHWPGELCLGHDTGSSWLDWLSISTEIERSLVALQDCSLRITLVLPTDFAQEPCYCRTTVVPVWRPRIIAQPHAWRAVSATLLGCQCCGLGSSCNKRLRFVHCYFALGDHT